jgi:hypothetical protein
MVKLKEERIKADSDIITVFPVTNDKYLLYILLKYLSIKAILHLYLITCNCLV